MSRENYRTIGALAGLAIGVGMMLLFGLGGLVPSAIFGAGGAVAGGMAGEMFYDRGKT